MDSVGSARRRLEPRVTSRARARVTWPGRPASARPAFNRRLPSAGSGRRSRSELSERRAAGAGG